MRKTTQFGALAAVSALLISGCVADGGETAEGDLTLVFTSYGSAYQEAQNEAMLTPWAESVGATIVNDEPTSYARIQQMVDAGQIDWDVVDTEPFFPVANCGTLVEEIDFTNIDTTKFPEGTVSPCSIPILQYSTVMVYNTETYAEPPTSYADFFDLENFPGVRSVPNWGAGGALELALLADGVAPEDLYPLDVDRAFAKLDTIRDSLVFWNTSSESQQALEDGTVDMSFVWSGRAYEAENNGATFEPVWENNLIAWATLSILKGSPNLEAAQSFIEYAATAEPQARFAELQPYSPANSDSAPDLDELQQKYNVADPAIQELSVVTDVDFWAENSTEIEEAWAAWSTS
ncbi:MAG: polyamine ABC transporter substrate-binding protein [Microbacteriaceae bacterium]|nr:polyamine ABC transporter substrate-binding protein [Microbacteriaceae bacterium]